MDMYSIRVIVSTFCSYFFFYAIFCPFVRLSLMCVCGELVSDTATECQKLKMNTIYIEKNLRKTEFEMLYILRNNNYIICQPLRCGGYEWRCWMCSVHSHSNTVEVDRHVLQKLRDFPSFIICLLPISRAACSFIFLITLFIFFTSSHTRIISF